MDTFRFEHADFFLQCIAYISRIILVAHYAICKIIGKTHQSQFRMNVFPLHCHKVQKFSSNIENSKKAMITLSHNTIVKESF